LPEAQRDRFLMKIVVEYPSPAEEVEIVQRMGVAPPEPSEALSIEGLAQLQDEADKIFVAREVVDYAVNLVFATREPERFGMADLSDILSYGASPRASLGLIAAGRALALLRGRTYVLPQDVYDVAPDIFRHRMVLSYEALARDISANDVLARVLSTVPAPRVAPSQDPTAHQPAAWATAPVTPSPAAPPPPPASATTPAPWVPPASMPAPPPPSTTDATPGASSDDSSSGWGATGEQR
jgi:MoxR-like ATPase